MSNEQLAVLGFVLIVSVGGAAWAVALGVSRDVDRIIRHLEQITHQLEGRR